MKQNTCPWIWKGDYKNCACNFDVLRKVNSIFISIHTVLKLPNTIAAASPNGGGADGWEWCIFHNSSQKNLKYDIVL